MKKKPSTGKRPALIGFEVVLASLAVFCGIFHTFHQFCVHFPGLPFLTAKVNMGKRQSLDNFQNDRRASQLFSSPKPTTAALPPWFAHNAC
jgi:hypothetical protein